ncbi:oligoendopeptidase, M3 family [Hathewaya proteolytica DSM 3090]|uniref:Oligoendopeptidase, M3 family n=1 Tax=Hathewaya proteolytica DSM 3090 TaxID=1121331 RepID=A0A1M6MCK6_9CLOT|nr:M3 family oligoendopeptidase [Hathewaya proteolytica]SHJ81186.1 oligoendopeptidase, M3 family [Hathewaya proteolytica DSM 3090]
MKFKEIIYKRPDIDDFKIKVEGMMEEFGKAESFQQQKNIIDNINSLRNNILTMCTIAELRNYINMSDEEYSKEVDYISEKWPKYEVAQKIFYKGLLSSKYYTEIVNCYGKQFLSIAKTAIKTVTEDVVIDMAKESNLQRKYTKLMAQATIEYNGELKNINQLKKFCMSSHRETRKYASEKKYELLEMCSNDIDEILDELIKVRTRIAKKMGYSSFTKLAYDRLNRVDYCEEDIEKFRNLIVKYILPICKTIIIDEKKRLGVESLKYYDEEISCDTLKIYNVQELKDKFQCVCNKLSEQTKDVYRFMKENELMDLEPRDGKARLAMSTYLCDYKSPFIVANLSGIEDDFRVLAHEFGHAFQMYISNLDNKIPEYILPTKEAAEIASITMEFLVCLHMGNELEDSEEYKNNQIHQVMKWMPYRACIDEFQHCIYNAYNMTKDERKKLWSKLEKKYMPFIDYDHNAFLEQGNFWKQQSHIFTLPFYYIDYALAQICALNIWEVAEKDGGKAWESYMNICKKGGSLSFMELLKIGNISSPFEEETFKKFI